jgi:mannosyltransferase
MGNRAFAVAVVVTAALCLALESFHLGSGGLTFDEAATVSYASLDPAHLFAALQLSDAFFGAYYAWMHVWMLLGSSEPILRSYSVLCAAGAVIAVAFLARRLADTKAGIAAGILAAASPLLLDLGRQARPYALLVLLAALSSLAFLRAAERPTVGRWVVYVLVTAAGCYAHLFLLCLVAAHVLWALTVRPGLFRSGLAWSLFAIALSTLPLVSLLAHYPVINVYIPRPTWRAISDTWQWFAGSREFVVLDLLLLAALIVMQLRQRKRITLNQPALFLLLTVIVPPLLVFVESLFAKPTYLQRYLVEAWPSYIVALAIIVTRLPWYPALIGLLAALQLYFVLPQHLQVTQNWRAASAIIFANALPGDQLAVYPAYGMLPYQYYLQRQNTADDPILRFPTSPPFPLKMSNTTQSDKFGVGRGVAATSSGRIWFLVGWTDDPRTAAGLRILRDGLPRSYHLAYDCPFVHEEVLRFDSGTGARLESCPGLLGLTRSP